MIFQIRTVAFKDRGQIDCRFCNHGTVFPNGAQVISYIYFGRQEIISVTDLTVMHRCGRTYIWWCATCEEERPPPRASRRYRGYRGWQGNQACAICGEKLTQRSVYPQPVDDLVGEPVDEG